MPTPQELIQTPHRCTSISAMESKGNTVLAGCGGSTSSEMGYDWMVFNGGDWAGVMLSKDGGETWAMTNFPKGYFVTAFVLVSEKQYFAAARAKFDDRDDGGVWATGDAGKTWQRVFGRPVYDLVLAGGALVAAVPWTSDANSAVASRDGGKTWHPFADGVDWDGRAPFYPTFAVSDDTLFLGALTVNPQKFSDTASRVFSRPLSDLQNGGGAWSLIAGQPDRLDVDGMPKDRMALLALDDDTLYVAGNADALVWRVQWKKGEWTEAHSKDTEDGSLPRAAVRFRRGDVDRPGCDGDRPRTRRDDAAAATWLFRGDGSRRRRGRDVDRPRTRRGDAVAATWLFRGDQGDAAGAAWMTATSRCRRGCGVDIPWRSGRRRGYRVDSPRTSGRGSRGERRLGSTPLRQALGLPPALQTRRRRGGAAVRRRRVPALVARRGRQRPVDFPRRRHPGHGVRERPLGSPR